MPWENQPTRSFTPLITPRELAEVTPQRRTDRAGLGGARRFTPRNTPQQTPRDIRSGRPRMPEKSGSVKRLQQRSASTNALMPKLAKENRTKPNDRYTRPEPMVSQTGVSARDFRDACQTHCPSWNSPQKAVEECPNGESAPDELSPPRNCTPRPVRCAPGAFAWVAPRRSSGGASAETLRAAEKSGQRAGRMPCHDGIVSPPGGCPDNCSPQSDKVEKGRDAVRRPLQRLGGA